MLDTRPPPCSGFSFTMVDSHRAMLFGGKQEEHRVSDIYMFDFDTMVSVVWEQNQINSLFHQFTLGTKGSLLI